MPNPKRRHSKTRTAKRRTHDALDADAIERLPAVPRAQGAASCLPALRLLPRPAGPRGRRRRKRHCRARSSFHDLDRRRRDGRRPRAVAASSTARWPRRGISISGFRSSGSADVIRAELARHPDADELERSASSTRPTSSAMAESPAAALRRKPRRVDPRGRRVGGRAARRRRSFSAGHTGATVMAALRRVRHAAGRRSAGAGGDDSDGRPAGGAARRRRQRRVPAAASAAVRASWVRLRAGRARHRAPARRAAVDRRGRDQGQRADARGASAAEGLAARTSSATSRRATCTAATPT